MTTSKLAARNMRHNRVRAKVSGTAERPRLSVYVSLRNVTAQIVDDTKGHTLAHVTTVGSDAKGNLTDKATWVGEHIAEAAKKAKVKQVVFDRGGRLYHGRLNALATAAREKGLEF
jgi:large subunit ribosomal protein L18